MPVLLAGILSLPMIVVIGYVVRGGTYERAINNEMLSLFDAASLETDAFSVADPFFDLSSLIWRDDVSYTLFPKLGRAYNEYNECRSDDFGQYASSDSLRK